MKQNDKARAGGLSCSLDYLLVNLGRNELAAKRLVQLFLDNVPNLVERLEVSARNGDLHALQSVVHDVRGHCVLFSAHQCLEKSRFLENALRDALEGNQTWSHEIDWSLEAADLCQLVRQVVVDLGICLANGATPAKDAP
jgi:HPt (histidine-containing phosphotransfer) domain-containing protein